MALVLASSVSPFSLGAQEITPGAAPLGRITGRVLDRDSGRPVPMARVQIVGQAPFAQADLDGRYRTQDVPPGIYAIRALSIGYQPVQIDSVRVEAGQTATADFAMKAAAIQLEGIAVQAEVVSKPSTAAGLLALQQAAPSVSDGISAQAMSRTPDSDAADAVARVTGISVFDNKFVVVRGLPERYSNTLLNGAELVSPEPLRRVVPLDIFPASLLEAIVTTKAATPDRPGDFAGGSVEIKTKDFPEQFIFQVNLSQGYNSLTTFRELPLLPRSGLDFLGYDDGRRQLPAPALEPGEALTDPGRAERFGESIRNVWTPALRRAAPDLGFGLNLGGQLGAGSSVPIGYVLGITYSSAWDYTPERLFALFTSDPGSDAQADRSLLYEEGRGTVDWGTVANLTFRLGSYTKIAWRNLVTRNAQESALNNAGYDTENARVIRSYQVRYTEQSFLQSQIAGEHLIPFFFGSRLEWKGTVSQAQRDEPDNRQVKYILQDGEFSQATTEPTRNWVRYLDDRILAGQVDWTFPFSLRQPSDAQFKMGGLQRVKDRVFDAQLYTYLLDNLAPNSADIARLPPEEAFAPENVGSVLRFERTDAFAQSYEADDDVTSFYGMLDIPVFPWLRLVGGVRRENWRLNIFPGSRDSVDLGAEISQRRNPDWLWSSNLTLRLSDRMNLRFAGFRTVSRPDARELSPDSYVAVTGDCENVGNASIERTRILNADARWEIYPNPGEIVSVSGFYKKFDLPIVELVGSPGGGQCNIVFANATSAKNYGAEFEFRKAIGPLFTGFNLTWVDSRVAIDPDLGDYPADLALQGQSPYLINANLGYSPIGGRLEATVLFNYFADRIARYGRLIGGAQAPSLIERGRVSLDAKLRFRVGGHLAISMAGKNLTDEVVMLFHRSETGLSIAGSSKPGIGLSLGVGYEF